MYSQFIRSFVTIAALLPMIGCGKIIGSGGANAELGQGTPPPQAFGYVVADEPQAALVGRNILNNGGNAADAAAAVGFAMAVTLPSRAGLGGGGACVIKVPDAKGHFQPPIALLFPPGAPATNGGDRPAAVPSMARGLLVMEARFGSVAFSSIIAPAERLAGGVPVSPALESDLSVVGNALLADPNAAQVFANPNGQVLQTGDNLSQPDLVSTFEILRTQGILGFYQGSFPGQFTAAANQAGADITAGDVSSELPQFVNPALATAGTYQTASLPYPTSTETRPLPATAAFEAVDKNGGVVACAVTMNNLFGTGRIAAGTGILLAASPSVVPVPELRAAIAYRPGDGNFRAAVTGTGQEQAPAALAAGLATALGKTPVQAPELGRTNIISCPNGVPGGEGSCTASADPRGQGLAIGGR